jgi:hypothetical protein
MQYFVGKPGAWKPLGDFSVDAKVTIRYMLRINSFRIHMGFLFG